MGTHPIFESDFDCLTEWEMALADFSAFNFNPVCTDYNVGWARKCEEKVSSLLDECLSGPNTDDCEKQFEENALMCPCRQNDFGGCPSRSIDCRPHVDPMTAGDIQAIEPTIANPEHALYLFQSDEFEV